MATIEIDRVTKVYGNGFLAVDDVSIEIADGEFVVLVGPSGCGKSTLLRMIAGLEEVTAGTVRIGGADVTDLAPRHRDIAMVFQNYALYPHMTVRENLGYGLKVRRAGKSETRRRVDEVAGLLGLGELLDRKPAQLSGGQRQRVAMGRAIVREPQAFLMDEPLSNLDAKLRVAMRASLAQLHAKLGVTTIYVTHDQTEAMTLGQRVAVMRDGHIVQFDEPQALYRRPQDVFVAAFIGSPSMNLVEATVEGTSVRFGQFTVPLDPAIRPATEVGAGRARDPARGIRGRRRPRHLRFLASRSRSTSSRSSEPRRTSASPSTRSASPSRPGDDDDEDDATRCSRPTRRSSRPASTRARAARQGTTASLAVDPARFHFFDAVDGESLRPPAPAAATASVAERVVLTRSRRTLRWREVRSRGRR